MLLIFVTTLLIVNSVSEKLKTNTSFGASVLLRHPRISENCIEQFEGSEGVHIKGFQLQQVFIATTSGLQTPHIHNGQSSMDQDNYSHFCSFRNFPEIHKSEKVINYLETLMIKDKFRGKVTRSDFKIFNSMAEAKHCRGKSLSTFGVLQLINLGQYLLKSYFGQLKSLNTIFLPSGFASTFGDETLFNSLNALLYGLLTEKQFVHTHIDKLPSDFSQVKQLKDVYQDLHYYTEQSFTKESHFFKDTKISEISRSKFIDMLFGSGVSAKDIIGHLSNSLCPAVPSQSVKTLNLSDEDISNIFNVSDFYNTYLTTSSMFQSYSVTRTFPLRQLVKNWLSHSRLLHEPSTSSGSKDDLKMITVDDLFMLSFLSALNIPVSKHVAPSSRLIIESFLTLTSGSVPINVDLISGEPKERNNISFTFQEQERHKSHANNVLPGNSFHDPKTTALIDDNMPQKMELNGPLKFSDQGKNISSEMPGKRLLVHLSPPQPPSVHRMKASKEYSKKESDDLKLLDSQSSHVYVRILYNGQVITAFIPGCEGDQMISLGLCSFETFQILLDNIEWQHFPARDKL